MDNSPELIPEKEDIVRLTTERPYVAVASQDGLFINLHLGEADNLRIYQPDPLRPMLVDIRTLPAKERRGVSRWREVAALLKDCASLLVSGIGQAPRAILMNAGLSVHMVEGFIEKAITSIGSGKDIGFMHVAEQGCLYAGCMDRGVKDEVDSSS